MSSGPATLFSGTTAPARKERPGPDSFWTRMAVYLAAAILLPISALTAGTAWILFHFARMRWWAPAPVAALGLLWMLATGGIADHISGHITSLANTFASIGGEDSVGSGLAAAIPGYLWSQLPLGLFIGGTWATIALGWRWVRRPAWERREIRPGLLLKRRYKKTAAEIAAGVNPPSDGVTVGVAIDLRDPRFAAGKPGTPYGERTVLTDAEGAGHCLVVGGSGSGKTQTMLVGARDVMQRGHGLVVVDCKGGPDVPAQIAEWAAEYDRDFYHWEMFDPRAGYEGPAEGPGFYNPIGRGDPSRRKDLLLGSQANAWQGEAEYYKSIIGDYLQTMFTVMDLVPAPPGVDTFKDVSAMLSPAALVARAANIPKDRYPDLALSLQHVAELGDRERSAISNMYARLNTLTASIAGQWLRFDPNKERDIDLVDIADRGAVVVFSLDSSNYEETTSLLAGLIVQDLKTVSSTLRESPAATPMHVYIDEFSAVDATNIYGLLAKARDARMPVTLATQALADLKRREPYFDAQVLGIVSSFLIHRANSEEDARIFSGLAGVDRRMVHRVATEGTTGAMGTVGAAAATGSGYLQDEEAYRVDPGVFQRLRQGQCVFIAKMPEDRYVSPVQVVLEDHTAMHARTPAIQPDYRTRPAPRTSTAETFPYPGTLVTPSTTPNRAPAVEPPTAPPPPPPARPTRPNLQAPPKPPPASAGTEGARPAAAPVPTQAVPLPREPMTKPEESNDWGTV